MCTLRVASAMFRLCTPLPHMARMAPAPSGGWHPPLFRLCTPWPHIAPMWCPRRRIFWAIPETPTNQNSFKDHTRGPFWAPSRNQKVATPWVAYGFLIRYILSNILGFCFWGGNGRRTRRRKIKRHVHHCLFAATLAQFFRHGGELTFPAI